MNEDLSCPCCSGLSYDTCCKSFHDGEVAPTAEKLMRSRYSAYALCLPTYLIETTYPSKRKGWSIEEVEDWSKSNKWQKLEILKSNSSVVEFKAYYLDENELLNVHHERSDFTKDQGRWFYIKGKFF